MNNVAQNLVPLELMTSLVRVLSHQIRTPLSVISNDLTYFKSLISPDECQRGIDKCRQISDFFKPAEQLLAISDEQARFDLSDVVRKTLNSALDERPGFEVCGNPALLMKAFTWIEQLFKPRKVSIIAEQRQIVFEQLGLKTAASNLIFTSVTQAYFSQASDDSILPMLVDAILLGFSCDCLCRPDVIELRFGELPP